MIQLLFGTILAAQETTSETVMLTSVRAARYSDHSRVSLGFGSRFQFENPVRHGNELRFRLQQGQPDIRLDICNNGEPIPPELREQIFIPFFTTRESGTGIGLSLSKQIMLKLGGDITLEQVYSGYTCFTLRLQA